MSYEDYESLPLVCINKMLSHHAHFLLYLLYDKLYLSVFVLDGYMHAIYSFERLWVYGFKTLVKTAATSLLCFTEFRRANI